MASTNKRSPDQFTNIQIDQVICSIGDSSIDRSGLPISIPLLQVTWSRN